MSGVSFEHTLEDLERDFIQSATGFLRAAPRAVSRTVNDGNRDARRIARRRSGRRHGTRYYKRITGEMTGLLVGEYGPHGDVAGNAVGAGWRHGGPNLDLAHSTDGLNPLLARRLQVAVRDTWRVT